MACLVRLNVAFLKHHTVPGLYRSGVVYGRTTIWDTIPALYAKRYGDCKSLAAALCAQYLLGLDPDGRNGAQLPEGPQQCKPVFRWNPNLQGGRDFHILVLTPYGYEDPSKRLGMGSDENAYFAPGNLRRRA